MGIIENAVTRARETAADDSHGYDQTQRWGPDYDCSSLVIDCFKRAGVPLSCTYTGNMYADMTAHGFTDVTASVDLGTGAGLERGDVLLNHVHHTALYRGGGQIVQASINERGGVTGGATGDQTGREIYERGYYNYPWDCVLRYAGNSTSHTQTAAPGTEAAVSVEIRLPQLHMGDVGEAVRAMQILLKGRGFSVGWCGPDGEFGRATADALMAFQRVKEEETDGVCGEKTWGRLLKG